MGLFSLVSDSASWVVFTLGSVLAYGYTILFVTAVATLIAFFYTSTTINPQNGTESRKSSDASTASSHGPTRRRRVSTIREGDEGDSGVGTGERPRDLPRRMRKRDWIKKAYRSLVSPSSPSRYSPTDDSSQDSVDAIGGGTNGARRALRRRHSTGPLQFAKDLVRGRGGRYFRQSSEANRDALPRPPVEFFEPSDLPEIPQNLSPEIFYILHNLKMLELPAEWKLDPRDIEVLNVEKDQVIVRPGDPDDAIYVPLTGSLAVFIAPQPSGREYMVKHIGTGGSFFSLLSMLDVLMKEESLLRTVSLRAFESGRVAKYPIASFVESYNSNPLLWIRPIQIVVTRLLHVTMTTLHNYMGLSSELMNSHARRPHAPPQPPIADERFRHASGGTSVKLTQAGRPKFNRAQSTVDGALPGPAHSSSHCNFATGPASEQYLYARKWLSEALCIGAAGEAQLEGRFRIVAFDEGTTIVEQGCEEEQLYLILQGSIRVTQDPVYEDDSIPSFAGDEAEEDDRTAAHFHGREMFGGLQMLTQEPSFYTFRAAAHTVCAVIDKTNFSALCDEYPRIYLPVAHSVLKRLSPFVRGVDFALDWVLVDSGHAVYRAGDSADSLYVVLSGRVRSVEKKTAVEEFGRGDMLGMMEVLQHRPRATTVLAVRFSQLARVPEGLLNFIKMTYPQVGFRLVQMLGQYYSSMNRRNAANFVPASMRSIDAAPAPGDPMSHIKNLHTIAIVPASPEVPVVAFTCELYHALSANLRVLRLSSEKVAAHLDPGVLEKYLPSGDEDDLQADFRLMHWLNVQEETYPLVIYECDYTATNWTRRCLRQADAILVVALGTKRPPKQAFMEEHLSMNHDGIRTNKELILLWPDETVVPSGTYEWLKGSWFSGHHHIRAPSRMMAFKADRTGDAAANGGINDGSLTAASPKRGSIPSIVPSPTTNETDIISYYEQHVFWEAVDFRSDFSRLARILTGNAIGLVLGGGGARGAAHVGVIRAIREAGIPIDFVGGTSIGSMIGGLFAESPNSSIEERAKSWFDVMCSFWRKVIDLTWSHSAMFTGGGFNKTIRDLFGDREIEDLWLPYFCISTDISNSEMRVHRSGPMWQYIRASMSLAGYLPPLCDPVDGHLLLDGGYVNNLPADIMRSMGARCVIAVDVGSREEMNLLNYGDTLNGWWAALRWLNPWAEAARILNNQEIQSRLAFVSCVRQLELVKKAPYCHYLRPEVDGFMTLEFAKFDIILEVGLTYGRQVVQELLATNANLRAALGDKAKLLTRRQSRRKEMRLGLADRSLASSFTDLAAAMSKIPRPLSQRRLSLTALDHIDDDDLYLCDFDGDYAMSSDFTEASESEDEMSRVATPKPEF